MSNKLITILLIVIIIFLVVYNHCTYKIESKKNNNRNKKKVRFGKNIEHVFDDYKNTNLHHDIYYPNNDDIEQDKNPIDTWIDAFELNGDQTQDNNILGEIKTKHNDFLKSSDKYYNYQKSNNNNSQHDIYYPNNDKGNIGKKVSEIYDSHTSGPVFMKKKVISIDDNEIVYEDDLDKSSYYDNGTLKTYATY